VWRREWKIPCKDFESLHNLISPPLPPCPQAGLYWVTAGHGGGEGGASSCQCCQVLTSIHCHIHKKPGHFRSFHGHIKKNLPLHDISKHNNNKIKTQCLVRDFVIFLFLLSIFGLNITPILKIKLDLYHSTFLLLTATFTATNLSSQIIFVYGLFRVI
jgi:hypothetical protein